MFAAALQMETWVQTNQVDLSFDKKSQSWKFKSYDEAIV